MLASRRSSLQTLRAWGRPAWIFAWLVLALSPLAAAYRQPGAAEASAAPAPSSAPMVVPAARRAKNVAVIPIKGEIDRVTSASVRRRIAEAQAASAEAIVLEIDTPGGTLGATFEICEAIESAKVPVVAWINGLGFSAGTYIALACREIVVSPAAQFGDAAPIAPDVSGLRTLGATERAKVLSPVIARLVNSARRNGYDEQFVQGFATLGVELWLIERADTGERRYITRQDWSTLFDGAPPTASPRFAILGSGGAPRGSTKPGQPSGSFRPAAPMLPDTVRDVEAALDAALPQPRALTGAEKGKWKLVEYVSDGTSLFTMDATQMQSYGFARAIVRDTEGLKAFFAAQNLTTFEVQWYEWLAGFLDQRMVKGALIVIGLLGLFIEMTHPGLILPGAVAFFSLALILAPDILLGAGGWWELIAVVLGIALILLELFVMPGFGVFGLFGLVLLFGGLLGTFMPSSGFPESGEGSSNLLYGAVTLVISTVVAIVGMYFVAKHFGRLPVINRLVLQSNPDDDAPSLISAMAEPVAPVAIGASGLTLSPLRPSGRVQIDDAVLDAEAEGGYIPANQPVRVTAVTSFGIRVEPITPPGRTDAYAPGTGPGQGPASGSEGGRG
jgi:membrane-bound serine protease (ClpP class)